VIRLGDGSGESNERMQKAVANLWSYTGELFMPSACEVAAAEQKTAPDLLLLKPKWEDRVKEVFAEATLSFPGNGFMHSGGKEGKHTEHLGYILAELQFMQRSYPNAQW
jgi:ring-1,2-phenylacetyl-CoA epoxidase subunit PaaC